MTQATGGAAARAQELSPAKREQILAGARRAFAEMGYERASVDRVAANAGVSKATVYNHFEDKKALFVACFSDEADAMRRRLLSLLGEPEGELREALQAIGEQAMALRLSPAVDCLYRHTIAEAARFPEIGRNLYERGPGHFHDALAAYLARWETRGALRLPDARQAAVQLSVLWQGDLVLRSQLGMRIGPDEVRATVAAAGSMFLRAYGTGAEAVASAPERRPRKPR